VRQHNLWFARHALSGAHAHMLLVTWFAQLLLFSRDFSQTGTWLAGRHPQQPLHPTNQRCVPTTAIGTRPGSWNPGVLDLSYTCWGLASLCLLGSLPCCTLRVAYLKGERARPELPDSPQLSRYNYKKKLSVSRNEKKKPTFFCLHKNRGF
jgi:hypothetical protein